MTIVRGVLLLCALVALLDGAIWEAVGLGAFVLVPFVAEPGGWGQRPVGFRIWFFGGGWRR